MTGSRIEIPLRVRWGRDIRDWSFLAMQPYYYLFYKLYRFASFWKWDKTPEFSAFLMIVCLIFCNAVTLAGMAELCLKVTVLPKLSNVGVVSAALVTALPQYFLLLHRQKFMHIVRDFESELPSRRRVGNLAVGFYVFLSFFALIGGALIRN